VVGNVFSGAAWISLEPGNDDVISNNLALSGNYRLNLGDDSDHGGSGRIKMKNNTCVDLDNMMLYFYIDDSFMPKVDFTNNLLAGISGFMDHALWYVHYLDWMDTFSLESTYPESFTTNLIWDTPENLYQCNYYEGASSEYLTIFTDYSDTLWDESLNADPVFVADALMGSYALAPSSPAVDAGTGDPDPDGSPNDIGCFGGPDGDWYRSYPWPL